MDKEANGHDKGLSIVMFSGTADKFIPLDVFVQTAANLGLPVYIFVTGSTATVNFRYARDYLLSLFFNCFFSLFDAVLTNLFLGALGLKPHLCNNL
jgi:hypothetical protein